MVVIDSWALAAATEGYLEQIGWEAASLLAMARAAIHLQVIATVFHAVEIEPDLSGCIGSTELLSRSSVSLQKTNHGTSSGFSIGKTGTQLKITIEILECAFNLMGPDRCPGSKGEKNRG